MGMMGPPPGVRALWLSGVVLVSGGLLLGSRAGIRAVVSSWEDTAQDARRLADMERQLRDTLARLERRNEVGRKLAAGRMTLPRAAAHFRALDRGAPAFHWGHFRGFFSGASDEERHCREVIRWARLLLAEKDPYRAEVFSAEMEAQLGELLGRGALALPEVSAEGAGRAQGCGF